MRPHIRSLILVVLWAVGVTLIWGLIPPVPRDWHPPVGEYRICGFIGDGHTLVMAGPPPTEDVHGIGMWLKGPIRLWDIETGRLLMSCFKDTDLLPWVQGLENHDLILVMQREGRLDEYKFRRILLNASTGKEVASFSCHIPRASLFTTNAWWWIVSADARWTAFTSYENEGACIKVHDIASGRLMHVLRGYQGPICFSPDGRRLAATTWKERAPEQAPLFIITIWDIATGEAISNLALPARNRLDYGRMELSQRGDLLLDGCCNVWEVDTGKLRFHVPNVRQFSPCLTFAPDGSSLLAIAQTGNESWLAHYDLLTGREHMERRIPLSIGGPEITLEKRTGDGRLLLVHGEPRVRQPTQVEQWLAKAPMLQRLGDDREYDGCILFETQSGREIMRANRAIACSPDGRFLLSWRNNGEELEIWDIPPRKPLRWLISLATCWTIPFALPVWRIARRRRKQLKP
ncbi:MAG TPA: hypothetical protein VGY66_19085 [Gemmataceae bacterium]|nr:hypothetical protein [Gemmataceae bacterium]